MNPSDSKVSPKRVDWPKVDALPDISYRQLEVFSMVCRERSYANAAVELHSTRANIKRVCKEFEDAVGRPLFEEAQGRSLVLTPFAADLLAYVSPLSRVLRKLGDGVRGLHEAGRILKFAAAGEFFRGGLFADFLATLQIADLFRSCFLRIEVKRFRPALLNAECDVYFGIGLDGADRLDAVDLGPVPWVILGGEAAPGGPSDLQGCEWWIAEAGESGAANGLLEDFRKAGAQGGSVLPEAQSLQWLVNPALIPADVLFFAPDIAVGLKGRQAGKWPTYRLTACLRRNHPYAELKPRLMAAANGNAHGH